MVVSMMQEDTNVLVQMVLSLGMTRRLAKMWMNVGYRMVAAVIAVITIKEASHAPALLDFHFCLTKGLVKMSMNASKEYLDAQMVVQILLEAISAPVFLASN